MHRQTQVTVFQQYTSKNTLAALVTDAAALPDSLLLGRSNYASQTYSHALKHTQTTILPRNKVRYYMKTDIRTAQIIQSLLSSIKTLQYKCKNDSRLERRYSCWEGRILPRDSIPSTKSWFLIVERYRVQFQREPNIDCRKIQQ